MIAFPKANRLELYNKMGWELGHCLLPPNNHYSKPLMDSTTKQTIAHIGPQDNTKQNDNVLCTQI